MLFCHPAPPPPFGKQGSPASIGDPMTTLRTSWPAKALTYARWSRQLLHPAVLECDDYPCPNPCAQRVCNLLQGLEDVALVLGRFPEPRKPATRLQAFASVRSNARGVRNSDGHCRFLDAARVHGSSWLQIMIYGCRILQAAQSWGVHTISVTTHKLCMCKLIMLG